MACSNMDWEALRRTRREAAPDSLHQRTEASSFRRRLEPTGRRPESVIRTVRTEAWHSPSSQDLIERLPSLDDSEVFNFLNFGGDALKRHCCDPQASDWHKRNPRFHADQCVVAEYGRNVSSGVSRTVRMILRRDVELEFLGYGSLALQLDRWSYE